MKYVIYVTSFLILTACSEVDAENIENNDVSTTEVANEGVGDSDNNNLSKNEDQIQEDEPSQEETEVDLYNNIHKNMKSFENIDYKFSGNQSQSERFSVFTQGMVKFKHINHGDRNYMVHIEDAITGERMGSVANEIGNYQGRVFFGLDEGDYILQVSSDGEWEIEIDQPFQSSIVEATDFSGSGSQTLGPLISSHEATEFIIDYRGESNLLVTQLDVFGDRYEMLFNEIGDYEGKYITSLVPGDLIYYIDINASGDWRLQID